MAIRELKCPSCGSKIYMDDDKDFVFCIHCGTKIEQVSRINISAMSPGSMAQQSSESAGHDPTAAEPKKTKLVWGIICLIIALFCLVEVFAASLIFAAIGVGLILSYSKNIKKYNSFLEKSNNRNGFS